MKQEAIHSVIESSFRNQAENDRRVKNAYLLVQSDSLNINLNIAHGATRNIQANPSQAVYLASVGKLFTATLISILYEKGKLDFNDSISKYLDPELMNGLHIYKGREYSQQITIRHLLMQTSGLNDVFYHLLEKIQADTDFKPTPREAILWGKENTKPAGLPGKKHFYTDTNYYLLGLIIENITAKKFHEAMHEMILEPLNMKHAYMNGFSRPMAGQEIPAAESYFKGVDLLSIKNYHQIDYAGGCLTAPMDEYLIFMKSLVNQKIIKEETLNIMVNDDIPMGFPNIGMNYGYSVWKFKPIPVIMPKEYFCWGCTGITGAFMFFHPFTASYIIGSFNDSSYSRKALQFMVRKIIRELVKLKKTS